MKPRALGCVLSVFAILLLVAGLGVWLLGFNGIMPWTHTVAMGAPKIVGERKDSQGRIIQQIIRQTDSSSTEVLFTPEGPRWSAQYRTRYYLQERDHSRRELVFVSDREFHYYVLNGNDLQYCDKCLAIEESTLWVAVGVDPVDSKTAHIVVFDDHHLLSHRTFIVVPKWQTETAPFTFENGNRRVLINCIDGLKDYDVVEDHVSQSKQK